MLHRKNIVLFAVGMNSFNSFDFVFQGNYQWTDRSVYAVPNWNTYPIHVMNESGNSRIYDMLRSDLIQKTIFVIQVTSALLCGSKVPMLLSHHG